MQSEEPDGLQIMIEGDGRNCISVGGGGHGFEASGIDAAVLRGRDEGFNRRAMLDRACLWGLLYMETGIVRTSNNLICQ